MTALVHQLWNVAENMLAFPLILPEGFPHLSLCNNYGEVSDGGSSSVCRISGNLKAFIRLFLNFMPVSHFAALIVLCRSSGFFLQLLSEAEAQTWVLRAALYPLTVVCVHFWIGHYLECFCWYNIFHTSLYDSSDFLYITVSPSSDCLYNTIAKLPLQSALAKQS